MKQVFGQRENARILYIELLPFLTFTSCANRLCTTHKG